MVSIPVVDAFEDKSKDGESHEDDGKLHLLLLQFDDVRVEGDAEEGHVLDDEDEVKDELATQGGHVLQRLGEGDQQRVHPDPVVDVDVGQPVANHVVEEAEVEDATLFPVLFGVTEN